MSDAQRDIRAGDRVVILAVGLIGRTGRVERGTRPRKVTGAWDVRLDDLDSLVTTSGIVSVKDEALRLIDPE